MSAARVQSLAERHGHVVKVVLRPDKGGALVEYSTVKEAGAAALGMEGVEVDGRTIHVGDAADLREGKAAELRDAKPGKDAKAKGHAGKSGGKYEKGGKTDEGPSGKKEAGFKPAPSIRRPGLGNVARGGGAGRRGGLGVKARPAAGEVQGEEHTEKTNGDEANGKGKGKDEKSNADFRAMVARGKAGQGGQLGEEKA